MSKQLFNELSNIISNIDDIDNVYNDNKKSTEIIDIMSNISYHIRTKQDNIMFTKIMNDNLSDIELQEFNKLINSICVNKDCEYKCYKRTIDSLIIMHDYNIVLELKKIRDCLEISSFGMYRNIHIRQVKYPVGYTNITDGICNNCILINNIYNIEHYLAHNMGIHLTFSKIINVFIKYLYKKHKLHQDAYNGKTDIILFDYNNFKCCCNIKQNI